MSAAGTDTPSGDQGISGFKRDASTLHLLKIIPIVALVAVSAFLLYLFYQYENREFSHYVDELRSAYLEQQKRLIEDETRQVIQLIEYAQRTQKDAQSEAELKTQLLREIEGIRFGKNGYFFIYDYQGVNLMHPMKPHLVGRNIFDLQDRDGVYVIRELIDVAKAGGAYVNYVWDKPDTQRPANKIGYAMGVGQWQWMVGTGVYIDDIEAVVQEKEALLAESIQESMLYVVVIVITVLVAISSLLFMLINRVSQSMIAYQQQIENHNERLEYEVDKKTEKLQKANRAKDEFLASMSHELRTPLTAIIGNSEFLAEQEQDGEKQKLIRSIEVAGRSQLALVNDILDMSKIESGKFTIDEAPYDLAALLEDMRHIFASRAHDAGLEFVVEQKNDETHQLTGDGQRIGQILINLISNAIKFTEKGRVTLTTSATENYLYFTVEDTGIGIPPAVMDQLFQRFEQADQSISRRFGGSGLGLFISESLSLLMGGMIDASSHEGEGSKFQLILPYRPSDVPVCHEEDVVTGSASVLTDRFSGSVLIAEDTPELQMLERRILESLGVTVTVVNNGRMAVDAANRTLFDLILMDMQMPEMNGIEATEALRAADNRVPIVALTANVMQKHRDAFKQAGCDGFLAKPIDKQELKVFLRHYLSSEEPQPQTVAEPASTRDELVDDELMAIFTESATRNRGQLMQALAAKEWEGVREVAHSIKGGGSSFGFPELSRLGREVCDAIDEDDFKNARNRVMDLVLEIGRVIS